VPLTNWASMMPVMVTVPTSMQIAELANSSLALAITNYYYYYHYEINIISVDK